MLYINYIDLNSRNLFGIKKKVLAQCRAFEKVFGTVYYTIFAGSTIYLLHGDKVVDKEFAIASQMVNDVLLKWLIKYEIKRIYIRYGLSDIWFLNFLEKIKRMNIKGVLEFPTIPYDDEGWVRRPIEDKYYREQLHKYINYCTTYADFETVFGIPCITLVNGVDIEEHREKKYRKKDGTIVLLAVASLSKWHGYERVIQGMYDYYTKGREKKIIFNVVGAGGQLSYYEKLTEEYHLDEHVIFHGQLKGAELDAIYDNSDIAVGSLGYYKSNLRSGSPIKLGEYCARGIPFVYGYDDISFSKPPYFSYQVSNDATPLDMEKVLDFYDAMYDGRDFIKDMRQYTLSNLTWDTILQPVIDYLS